MPQLILNLVNNIDSSSPVKPGIKTQKTNPRTNQTISQKKVKNTTQNDPVCKDSVNRDLEPTTRTKRGRPKAKCNANAVDDTARNDETAVDSATSSIECGTRKKSESVQGCKKVKLASSTDDVVDQKTIGSTKRGKANNKSDFPKMLTRTLDGEEKLESDHQHSSSGKAKKCVSRKMLTKTE